jgi:predicted nucleic acid-binding Zn ribbon protein
MKNLFYIFFIAVSLVSYSQKVETTTDSTKIRIGSQFHLILKTKVDTASAVIFPKEQMFGALEVLEDYPTDTIIDKKDRAKYELIKKYGLTQFDSGRYVIPQLKVLINNKPFLTDSLFIEVTNIQVDTLKQPLYDIKDVIADNQASSMKWWMWLLIALVLIGGGVWAFLQWKKKQNKISKEPEVIYTPIEKATIGLKKLEEKQLIEKGAVKDYYSELTDIARTYLEEAVKIPAMENTTAELIENLKRTALRRKLAFSDEIITSLEKVLKQADLVKFAKSKPLDFEIVEDRKTVEKTLRTMHGIIPLKTPEEEEAERNEEIRLELERKRKKKKMISNISFAAGILVVVGLAYWIATSGISSVKNKFFGSPTTEFLTSEWIISEYGTPPIKIETPKVLKRMQSSDFIPDEMKALFKELTMFGEGAIFGDYYIMVSTMKFQEQAQQEASQIDLNLVLDGNYSMWEKQGAKNILMQKEQYQTGGGIEGMKAYGTLDFLNPITKSSTKVYYEMLVFKQAKGIQQIITIIKESDPNKKEIIDRIINSVELGQAR